MVALLREAEEMKDEDYGAVQAYCCKCEHRISIDWLNKTVEQQSIYVGVDSKEFYKEFYKEFSLRPV